MSRDIRCFECLGIRYVIIKQDSSLVSEGESDQDSDKRILKRLK